MTIPTKNKSKESWKEIIFQRANLAKSYHISNHGAIKSINRITKKERILKISPDHRGFFRVSIKTESGVKGVFVHKEVAKAFLKQKTEDHTYLIHKDIDKANNHLSNLSYVTKAKKRTYLRERREKYNLKRNHGGGNFKLTHKDVLAIKKLLQTDISQKDIAIKYNIGQGQISRIASGENWSHVKL